MIAGKRLRLWSIEKEDLLKNYIWGNDPEIISVAGMSPYPISFFEIERWYNNISTNPAIRVFAVKTNEGEYIGNIELSNINWRARKAEIGIAIGEKEYWHKGFGTESLELVMDFAFNEMNLERLQANVLESNSKAIDFFQKAGFIKEGILRKAFYNNGKFCDIILLGLLKSEYAKK